MADVKISDLTAAEAATADDLIVLVDDPSGTPSTKKLTIAELATAVAGDKLPLAGGTMTGAIVFGNGGQNINVGSFDNSTGGSSGISLVCAVGYELNWQGGHLSSSTSAGETNYDIFCDSSLTLAAGKRITFGLSGGRIGLGTYDNGTGEGGGISLVDGYGYELNWQGGRLAASDFQGYTNFDILCDSSLTLAAGKRITFGDATYLETAPGGGGSGNTASGYMATVSGGQGNTASEQFATVSGGYYNTASGLASCVTGGQFAVASIQNSRALSSGAFVSAGDAQAIEFVLMRETTSSGTSAVTFYSWMGTHNPYNIAQIPVKTVWAFTVKVAAYSVTDNVGAAWTITGALRRNAAGTTAIVGTNTTVTVTESALSSATCAVVADTSYNAIKINVTGISSTTIRWVAHVTATQVSG